MLCLVRERQQLQHNKIKLYLLSELNEREKKREGEESKRGVSPASFSAVHLLVFVYAGLQVYVLLEGVHIEECQHLPTCIIRPERCCHLFFSFACVSVTEKEQFQCYEICALSYYHIEKIFTAIFIYFLCDIKNSLHSHYIRIVGSLQT